MAEERKERTYIIPLRKEWLKVPRYKRAKKAVTGVKDFLKRHMKSENVKVGEKLNLELWKHGIKNPPHKVKVTVTKDDDGIVKAELFGHKYVAKVKAEKKEEPKGIAGKLQSALGKDRKKEEKAEEEKEKQEKPEEKKEEKKPEVKKTEKKPEAKPAKKEEKKPELKKQEPKQKKKAPAKKPAAKAKKTSPEKKK